MDVFCEKVLEAFPMSDKDIASSFKMDMRLAKAEPVSKCGSTSGRT